MTDRNRIKATASAAMIALLALGSASAQADNTTFANRAYSSLGSANTYVTSPVNSSASRYWAFSMTAGRSYVAFGYPFAGPDALGGSCDIQLYDAAGAFVAGVGGDEEPDDFITDGDTLVIPNAPPGSFEYTVQLLASGSATQGTTCMLRVVETTLFSPWFFRNVVQGYNGFAEIKNNTLSTVTVTVNAFSPAGTLFGSTSLPIAPNGVALVTASSLGAPDGFGSMSIAHTGKLGAISANITTLSATTGLSFDASFTTRELIPRI